eukprot:UN08202
MINSNAITDPFLIFSTTKGIRLASAPSYVRTFYINPHNKSMNATNILFTKGGIYNVLTVQHSPDNTQATTQDINSGQARYVAFVSNSRIAILTKDGELQFFIFTK